MSAPRTARRALVTGGSGELGGAICHALAGAGWHVIVHAHRSLSTAEQVVLAIRAAGGSAQSVAFDVSDADASRAALDELLAEGTIHGVINNAGIHDDAPMAGMSGEQWHRVIDVSLHGFFNVTQPLLLPMARARFGRIVSISSVAAQLGNRGQANYAAAKAALHGASKSRHHRQRGGAGGDRRTHGGCGVSTRTHPRSGAGAARGYAAGGGGTGCVPVRRCGGLHQWPGDRGERGDGVAQRASKVRPPAVIPPASAD
jgi:NADP-dependent 3-hydroxy acid dehydrogenase YdfG